jgi:hypothetical protein
MSIIGNPVENGVVSSLAQPGGNITGSSFFSDEVTAKRLEILKTGHPHLVRVGFLTNPQNVAGAVPRKRWRPWHRRSTSSFSSLACALPTSWTGL